ncbi:MAG: molybdopterin molybdotransferase MoeA [Kutzneria sp.]|nr:molybdopterin molybdotransferase MoeA [Kutzneria sp.]MBV9844319.1 molybdopterin molybdotransferase MoeA [Kutzneria sp.]
MRSVDDQLVRVLGAAVRPPPVRVAISEAHGQLCAEEVVAERALPGFDQAAVDGYAVRSVDVQAAADGPVTLPVVGEIAAGSHQPRRLQPGQAVRVTAGAPLPTLADAVMPLEYTDGHQARVTVRTPVPSGAFVRRAGEDVQTGDIAVRSGTVVGSAQVGLLAAVGRDKVLVHPRPRVSVVSLGDELVDVDRTPGPGQVYDVNSYALAAAARDAGAEVARVGIVASDPRRLRDIVESRLLSSEILLISGGTGGYAGEDVRSTLAEFGELDTTRIAMHPGSAQGYGLLGLGAVPTFLLPSNPMSALVVFEVFVRPLIRAVLGKRNPHRKLVAARLLSPITSTRGRRGFVRGQLLRDPDSGDLLLQPLGLSGTHLLASLAEANCLAVIDEEVTEVPAGEEIQVRFLAHHG